MNLVTSLITRSQSSSMHAMRALMVFTRVLFARWIRTTRGKLWVGALTLLVIGEELNLELVLAFGLFHELDDLRHYF